MTRKKKAYWGLIVALLLGGAISWGRLDADPPSPRGTTTLLPERGNAGSASPGEKHEDGSPRRLAQSEPRIFFDAIEISSEPPKQDTPNAVHKGQVSAAEHQQGNPDQSNFSGSADSTNRAQGQSQLQNVVRQVDHKLDNRNLGQFIVAQATDVPPAVVETGQDFPGTPPIAAPEVIPSLFLTPIDAPLGFAGRSGVLPRDAQQDNHFVPVEDRWRIGFPEWDRYGKGHPVGEDYPYVQGRWFDPFNQNVLKGDYPILGQNIFLEITGTSQAFLEPRQTPTATTPFESTANPNSKDFFGNPNQFFYSHNFFLSFDLFHGDAAFRPVDWRVKLTPAFNINTLSVSELAVVGPDVTDGLSRYRTFVALQEWFLETKIADIGTDYDFISLRVGAQPFTSDFRGFIFSDTNRGVRLFGTNLSNRDQFNVVYFDQLEKDTNSGFNTFRNRSQQIIVANYYKQDFIFPGYTAQWSVHYDHDSPTFKFDNNGFLVRPDPVGVFQPHTVDAVFLGWTGDGHINHLNVNHAFYWALGHDSLNPLANRPQDINAQMAALEASYDQDWLRFRSSVFWASGDHDVNNSHATGFDTILDNPNFAGGEFTYWQRQQLKLFGVDLVQRMSLVPDLRSSKIQGQANFVNPGLFLTNVGVDMEITPKFRIINNANLLWFQSVEPLQQFTFAQHINHFIGVDLSIGAEYRPYLNNNMIFKFGFATLLPGQGFQDLFSSYDHGARALYAAFMEAVLTF